MKRPKIYDFKLQCWREMTLSEFQKQRNSLINWRLKGMLSLGGYLDTGLITKRERNKLNKALKLLKEISDYNKPSYLQLKKQYKYKNK